MSVQNLLIAGGGIGGLTAALCAALRGISVDVFEQSAELAALGAGIQLSPNCTKVLHYLGLEEALREWAFLPQKTQFLDWKTGRVISENPLGDAVVTRYGAPYYHIHRGDLLKVLSEACTTNPNIKIHLHSPVSDFTQDEQEVRLTVGSTEFKGDVLVGADGIHSAIRTQLWGQEKPRFTGNVAWRALVPASRLPGNLIAPNSTVWWGPGRHFVHYYVSGGEYVNCVCVVEKEGWETESWTELGEVEELRRDFSGWHSTIQTLIEHADQGSLFKWALHDRDPMPSWGHGRVTLLGDACHPTLPFMAQGAAMAIEDAVLLAGCLAQGSNVQGADVQARLTQYEGLRRPRTNAIQKGSRRNATVFHMRGVQAWLRNRAARRAGNRTLDRLFSYDVLKVTDQISTEV